jgi:hypothetical protein
LEVEINALILKKQQLEKINKDFETTIQALNDILVVKKDVEK